jgi:predicted TIM-barrel enzyme
MNKDKLAVVFPVIHFVSEEQVTKNLELLSKHSINKVFLINHSVGDTAVTDLCRAASIANDMGFWVGINFLSMSALNAVEFASGLAVQGIWTDAGHTDDPELCKKIGRSIRRDQMWFGGFAFKYQSKQPSDYAKELAVANDCMTVITTSGKGTGEAPPLYKIQKIQEHARRPLAIASGVDKDNIKDFMKHDVFILVASSITGPGELIDETKLVELMA